MMTLTDSTPIAHNNDPATSHEAAELVTASGTREKHALIVLDLLRRNEGLTAIELWHAADDETQAELKEPQEVRRRLSDMLGSRVRQGPSRKCRVRNTTMVTWFSIGRQGNLFE
jgi:hypothetical protein